VRKSLIVVFGLVFLIGLILVPALPVKAQVNQSVISLRDQNIVSPNTDLELISLGKDGTIYAIVKEGREQYLFKSEDEGRSWEKVSGKGLPEREVFVSFKTSPDQPEILVVATTTMVYLSGDQGESFQCLGGPEGLVERGEEITSLAISDGNHPQILVGIWHPSQGKFAQEGVYLRTSEGKREWEAQGMKPTWQGRGYKAEVTSVAFSPNPLAILAITTGDPDREGSLPEGTYLNLGFPNQRGIFGADWNNPDYLPDWPVEVAETPGLSPTEGEILNSKMALSGFEYRAGRIYIIYNTRDRSKDDVYRIEFSEEYGLEEVRKLEVPKTPEISSLDSIDYTGTTTSGTLAVGVTCKDRDKRDQAQVYYLSAEEERLASPHWSEKRTRAWDARTKRWIRVPDTRNCQIVFAPDFAKSGIIFAATSGKNSSFARSYKDVLVPISLMDISGGINQISPSPRFLADRTLFCNYGDRNILKVVLGEDYQLKQAERILLTSERFNPAKIKIEPYSNHLVFVFEVGANWFWLTKNGGLSWSNREREIEIMDLKVLDDEVVYIAGKDSMIYRSENTGTSWQQRISSGIRWLQKIELGPERKILAVGGSSKENRSDTISLLGEDKMLPSFPVSVSYPEGLVVVYSQKDNSVYCGANNQLYRLAMERGDWEKITEFGRRTTELLISPQGLYLFCKPQVYFSSFPLSEDSQWENLEIKGNWLGCRLTELDERSNLLFLWDSSKIAVYLHQIPEEEPEEEILPEPVEPPPVEPLPVEPPVIEPPPVEPEPVEPQPVEPEPVVPEPPTPPAPPVGPPPASSVLPWPLWIVIGLGSAFGIYLLIAYLVTSRTRL